MPKEPMTLEEAKETYPAMWCIYDHPSDYPDCYVARKWYGPHPTGQVMVAGNVEQLRNLLFKEGRTKIPRYPTDDAKIVEVWV